MLTSKRTLAAYLRKQCDRIVFDKDKCEQICNDAYEQHNVTSGTMMDLIADRTELREASEFLLFVLAEEIDKVNGTNELPKYFTEIEIKGYSKQRLEVEKVFPLKLHCIRVSTDQYIGATDIDFLMKLRKAQLINYNENAQRTMQRVVRGDKSFYRITLNMGAVKAIQKSLHEGRYIPNTITLNIPEDVNSEYYFDEDSSTLVINSLEHFDISDGYHRFMAMCREKDSNPDFDYPVELRIITFSDDKVKQFIFQEDQKTKMRKIDSDSMNMSNQANILVERLNTDSKFDLVGKIQRNGGSINFSELASIIGYQYFKGKKKNVDTRELVETKNQIRDSFNRFLEMDTANLDKTYDFRDLYVIIYGIKNGKSADQIDMAVKRDDNLDRKIFVNKLPRKKMEDVTEELYENI